MLSKKQRLSRKEFSLLYKNGKRGNTKLFSFIYKKTDKKPQFSVVVSKKVSKKSPQRHLIKRRVYSAIREFLAEYPDFSYSVILLTLPSIKESKYNEIKEVIYKNFELIN